MCFRHYFIGMILIVSKEIRLNYLGKEIDVQIMGTILYLDKDLNKSGQK